MNDDVSPITDVLTSSTHKIIISHDESINDWSYEIIKTENKELLMGGDGFSSKEELIESLSELSDSLSSIFG